MMKNNKLMLIISRYLYPQLALDGTMLRDTGMMDWSIFEWRQGINIALFRIMLSE